MTDNLLCMFSFPKVLLSWMVPLFALWSHSKMNSKNNTKSCSTTASNIRVAILKLLLCQTVKVSCLI